MSRLSCNRVLFFFTPVKKRDTPVAHKLEVLQKFLIFVFLSGCMHCHSFTKVLTLGLRKWNPRKEL